MEGKTVQESSVTLSHVMMPQDANPAGNIHGGVVTKHIDEAAGVVAFRHTRSNVVTAAIERLKFHHPVSARTPISIEVLPTIWMLALSVRRFPTNTG